MVRRNGLQVHVVVLYSKCVCNMLYVCVHVCMGVEGTKDIVSVFTSVNCVDVVHLSVGLPCLSWCR